MQKEIERLKTMLKAKTPISPGMRPSVDRDDLSDVRMSLAARHGWSSDHSDATAGEQSATQDIEDDVKTVRDV